MSKRPYYGNARFIEIGSPGIFFRYLLNLDKVDGIRFEESFGTKEIPVPGTGVEDKPLETKTQTLSTGWSVVLLIAGQQHAITFPILEAAIACYNSILEMLRAVGMPLIDIPRLKAPPKPSPIVDVEGKKMESLLEGANEAIKQEGIEAGEEGEDLLDPVLDPMPILDDKGELIPITDEDIEEMEKPTPEPEVTKR